MLSGCLGLLLSLRRQASTIRSRRSAVHQRGRLRLVE